ncbi:hypothetical protein M899_1262 [Bacteriovorax sp. BSW11_IV]|uniref:hypothetical protein n=1 Tax=Bacteriovorax sp. BSW11_IV TaxID=1353529 RepID=UPI00038A499C|nr:hypothetical protein [Bacteriovorax sp. BSW11_IV]EQC45858.1 hypothetical protein M899_1262 [Bacteriovorax sp. BSW11_IV]
MVERIKKFFFLGPLLCLLIAKSHAGPGPLAGKYYVENFFKETAAQMLIHLDSAGRSDLLKSEIEAVTQILKETLQAQKVIAYKDLYTYQRTYSAIGDGFILLDIDKWQEAIAKGRDIRSGIISILLEINGIDNIDMAATLYSLLPRYNNKGIFDVAEGHTPFCLISDYKSKVLAHTKEGKGDWSKSIGDAKVAALNECEQKGLENCSLIQLRTLGFGKWQRYRYDYSGNSFSFARTSMFYTKCYNLSRCEDFYSFAPLGQLSAMDIHGLDEKIKECSER